MIYTLKELEYYKFTFNEVKNLKIIDLIFIIASHNSVTFLPDWVVFSPGSDWKNGLRSYFKTDRLNQIQFYGLPLQVHIFQFQVITPGWH